MKAIKQAKSYEDLSYIFNFEYICRWNTLEFAVNSKSKTLLLVKPLR